MLCIHVKPEALREKMITEVERTIVFPGLK